MRNPDPLPASVSVGLVVGAFMLIAGILMGALIHPAGFGGLVLLGMGGFLFGVALYRVVTGR